MTKYLSVHKVFNANSYKTMTQFVNLFPSGINGFHVKSSFELYP